MTIQLRKNQYQGVNAHLHSYFQSHSGWKSFHNAHITDLARVIAAHLPEGYTVDIEQSLQIEIESYKERTEPDVTIYQSEHRQNESQLQPSSSGLPTLTLPLTETLLMEEERYRNAIVIYRSEGQVLGKPVTRIELLSPTNKSGRGRELYIDKREFALRGGLPLVEVDYLHESPPAARNIPNYRRGDPESHPYMIIISDPRPSLDEGQTQVYGFDVDAPIPQVKIPLADRDTLPLNFDAVYHQTFESLPAYGQRVDYEQLPERFETYSEADQQRIKTRMQIVHDTHR